MSLRFRVITALATACLFAARSSGQGCEPHWLPGEAIPGVNNVPMCATLWDPDGAGPAPEMFVVGGFFQGAGSVAVNNIAAWDGATWSALGAGLPAQVTAAATFNGQLVAASSTTNGVRRWDGSAWTAFGPFYNVNAMLTFNGELFVAGGFSTLVNGVTIRNLAAWNGATWRQVGSPASGTTFYSLGVHNGQLYAGSDSNIWRLDGAALTSIGATSGPTSAHVTAITSFGSRLVIGGGFTSVGAVTVNRVAQWDGAVWSPMGSLIGTSYSSEVRGFLIKAGTLYACGPFTPNLPGEALFVASWDGTDWRTVRSHGGYWSGGPTAIVDFGGDMCVAGVSLMESTGTPGVARWNGVEWGPLGSTMNNRVNALARVPGGYVAAGDFSFAGGAPAAHVALWNGSAWSPIGTGLPGSSLQNVSSVAVYRGDIVAAGSFSNAGQTGVTGIARWNGTQWVAMGATASQVTALLSLGDQLYACGYFPSFSTRPIVAWWNGAEWQLISNFGANATALGVFNGQLVAAANGMFTWNGATWQPLGGPGAGTFGNQVNALQQYGNLLVAGGQFTSPPSALAAWDGTTWTQLGPTLLDGPSPAYVYALCVHQGHLLVGGFFDHAGGTTLNCVADWDGAHYSAVGGGTRGTVYALLSLPDQLVMGGYFTIVGGQPSSMLARWATPSAPEVAVQPVSVIACIGSPMAMSVVGGGSEPISYQWRKDTVPVAGSTSAVFTVSSVSPGDAGLYDCVLTNACGSVISQSARLAVSTADFNGDGDTGTDADIESFFACLAGNCCPLCGTADFNGDGDVGTDADIESFFRVLGGGTC